mmetsp:Transcript_1270/g.5002  ORF Transcript_1270/g.5002 Transcript_1270/m.5002 type:complete len:238 (-) Transcript_1270:549-1262(-)
MLVFVRVVGTDNCADRRGRRRARLPHGVVQPAWNGHKDAAPLARLARAAGESSRLGGRPSGHRHLFTVAACAWRGQANFAGAAPGADAAAARRAAAVLERQWRPGVLPSIDASARHRGGKRSSSFVVWCQSARLVRCWHGSWCGRACLRPIRAHLRLACSCVPPKGSHDRLQPLSLRLARHGRCQQQPRGAGRVASHRSKRRGRDLGPQGRGKRHHGAVAPSSAPAGRVGLAGRGGD